MGPRADAELALLEIPEAAQEVIASLLSELGYAEAGKPYTGKLPDEASTALKNSGLELPKDVTPTLVALAKLNWLRSKPRFDLF